MEIRNQVAVRAPLFCSVYIAVVNYKADPAAARAHASHTFRPAGHTLERPIHRNLDITGNQLEISRNHAEIRKSLELELNQLKSRGYLEISWKSRTFVRHNGPCREEARHSWHRSAHALEHVGRKIHT